MNIKHHNTVSVHNITCDAESLWQYFFMRWTIEHAYDKHNSLSLIITVFTVISCVYTLSIWFCFRGSDYHKFAICIDECTWDHVPYIDIYPMYMTLKITAQQVQYCFWCGSAIHPIYRKMVYVSISVFFPASIYWRWNLRASYKTSLPDCSLIIGPLTMFL